MSLLLSEVGALVMEAAEKVQLLNACFASVFIAKASARIPGPGGKREGLEKGWLSLGQGGLG